MENHEIRALLDDRNETIGKKIREAEMGKTPYMIILGEKEEANNTLSLRKHKAGDQGVFNIEELVKLLKNEIGESLKPFNA